MFCYIDDVLSLNNSRFGGFVDSIYTIELEIKDTTDTDRSASYLDLHLEIDSEGRLKTMEYRINWEIYTPYAGAAGMLLHMNGKFTMGKLKSSLLSLSFVFNRPSLSISRCRSRYEADLSVSVVSFISSSNLHMEYISPN
jgi:hypothetical protein